MHSFLKKLTSLDSINHEVFIGIFLAVFNLNFNFLNPSGFDRPVPLPCRSGKNGNHGNRCGNSW
jgi:hypothetical protein